MTINWKAAAQATGIMVGIALSIVFACLFPDLFFAVFVCLAGVFIAVMAWFLLYSFLELREIQRLIEKSRKGDASPEAPL